MSVRVEIPPEEFARYCVEMSAADEFERRAKSAAGEMQRTDLIGADRRFVETTAAHWAALARKLRDNAERRRNPERGNVVQLDQRARARAEAGR